MKVVLRIRRDNYILPRRLHCPCVVDRNDDYITVAGNAQEHDLKVWRNVECYTIVDDKFEAVNKITKYIQGFLAVNLITQEHELYQEVQEYINRCLPECPEDYEVYIIKTDGRYKLFDSKREATWFFNKTMIPLLQSKHVTFNLASSEFFTKIGTNVWCVSQLFYQLLIKMKEIHEMFRLTTNDANL